MYSIVMIFVLAVVVAILRIIAGRGGRKVNGFGLQRAVFLYRHF